MDVGWRIIVLDLVKSTSHLQQKFPFGELTDTSNTTPMKLWQFSNYFYRSIFVATIIFLELAKNKNGNVPGIHFDAFPTATKMQEA